MQAAELVLRGSHANSCSRTSRGENQKISMRIGFEVLKSFDVIMTTSTSDSEDMSVSANSNFGIRH